MNQLKPEQLSFTEGQNCFQIIPVFLLDSSFCFQLKKAGKTLTFKQSIQSQNGATEENLTSLRKKKCLDKSSS